MHHPLFFLALPLATLASLSYLSVATAQITPDNSLGAENSVVAPNVDIKGTPSDRIDGGAIRGDNLFHSFQEFNINAGRGAYFSNPGGIANILTRVTGGNVSNIQGILGVLGNANLFLINPNGIIFGPNARLDVGGSFLGSTANSLIFKNNFEFSATNPQAPPLLTITAPVGLSYRENFKNITSQSTNLTVPQGNSLTLVGGNVSLNDSRLRAPGGRVELGGLSASGTIGLNSDGSLSFPVGVQRADISLTNAMSVDVSSGGGGSIAVNARNLDILGGSILQAGIGQGLGTVDSQAGDINVDATGTINLGESSVIKNIVDSGATGNAGKINVVANSLNVLTGSQLENSTKGQGNAGNVNVNVRDTVSFDGAGKNGNASGIISTVDTTGVGNAGDINITARSLSVTNGAQLNTITFAKGNAGDVNIIARDTVSFDGAGKNGNASGILSTVDTTGVGNGGKIEITTGSLSLTKGAQLNALTQGQGNAGNVNIIARDTVSFDGANINGSVSGVFSSVNNTGVGNGGKIDITTGSLSLTGGAELSAITKNQGNAGNVNINARDTVSFDGVSINGGSSGIFSSVDTTGVGKGGDINITTGSLLLTRGGGLFNSTSGQGNAGNVNINASDTISFNGANSVYGGGSGVYSSVETTGVGNGGDIKITTNSLSAINGGGLFASTSGRGDAGNVNINARGQVSFNGVSSNQGSSGVFNDVKLGSVGNGRNIQITARELFVTNNARLSATSAGSGTAGNIEVAARSIRLDNGSTINADTVAGQGNITLGARDYVLLRGGSKITTDAKGTATGGNITINAGNLVAFPSENSDITAKAEESFGGRININTKGGIFGIEYRPQETPLSDITASSDLGLQFSGTVQINTPEIDPTQGLFELTETVVDPAQQIAQNPCIKGFGNSFTITGRGGLPTDPNKVLNSNNVRVDLIQPVASSVSSTSTTQKQPSQKPPVKQIIPAQGWIYNEKGEVVLVGYDPTKTGPQRDQPAPNSNCAAVK
ncbi:hypothetical protein DP113_24800 [Brasilonema octagenarum UFV-E1]|uniref:Filamentous haemagglutinin FhaB/tRNA nuclease CdiA-like TPS domain-containing protein n=1 Tax=Brasilonema sennae CENA114 TaxID=415709 RepID=A0A856MJ47_9CYAN|nr:S-layer family protein [Brasilonema sennae]QDL10708.1 hypothetical protein DP114_24900 [Brasilonema sennae CENA114]QDL17052.1 hypothetical protein DP113_24800 [Brasilonema octagenarum UFV-E1]